MPILQWHPRSNWHNVINQFAKILPQFSILQLSIKIYRAFTIFHTRNANSFLQVFEKAIITVMCFRMHMTQVIKTNHIFPHYSPGALRLPFCVALLPFLSLTSQRLFTTWKCTSGIGKEGKLSLDYIYAFPCLSVFVFTQGFWYMCLNDVRLWLDPDVIKF